MAKQGLGFKIENADDFHNALQAVPVGLRQKAMADAVRRGGNVVVNIARRIVTVSTGTLKKSLGVVVRNARSKYKDPYSVFGPRKGYARDVTRQSTDRNGKKRTRKERAVPANYAHLVELGHHVVQIGSGTLEDFGQLNRQTGAKTHASKIGRRGLGVALAYILPRPFLRPAIEQAPAQVRNVVAARIRDFNKREANRFAMAYMKAKGRI